MDYKGLFTDNLGSSQESFLEKVEARILKETNRKELLEHVKRLETIFDSIPEGVIVIDHTGQVNFSNRMAQVLLGDIPHVLEPEKWSESLGFYLDDETTPFPSKNMPVMRALQGEYDPVEEMILKPDPSRDPMWVFITAQPLSDLTGKITGATVILRDISYRKKVELSRSKFARRAEALYAISKSIAESYQNLSSILNTVVIHTAEFIGDTCVIALLNSKRDTLQIVAFYHQNPGARVLLQHFKNKGGYQVKDGLLQGVVLGGEPLLIPSVPADKMKMIATPDFQRFLDEVGVQSVLVVPITGRLSVLGALALTRDHDGKPYTTEDQSFIIEIAHQVGLAIEHRDLLETLRNEANERKEVQRALDESEVLFRSIFESTSLGIKVLDPDGVILQTNHAFSQMLGYPYADLISKPVINFLFPGDTTRWHSLFKKLHDDEIRSFILEHQLVHKDGSKVWVNASFTAIHTNNSSGNPDLIVAIVENITERKKLEMEMIEIKNRLRDNVEKERLHLAQELHDGPMQELYSASYQLEMLRNQVETGHTEKIDTIKQSIQKVVDELRTTAQELRPPTIAIFGLERAIRSHAQEIREKHPEIKIHLSLDRDEQSLSESIRLTLFRIYQGSISNILRHAEATEILVKFTLADDEALLEITDNGKGFEVPRSWIVLTRQGHFGLAGAAERVELLGGAFTVDSHPGQGSTIRTLIPCQKSTNGYNNTEEGKKIKNA